MQKTLSRTSIVLASALMGALLLTACSGQEEEPTEQPEAAIEESVSAEPIGTEATAREPIEVSIETSVTLQPDRRLVVAGETNLPDGARIQVIVERELSSVRWQSRTSVREGNFEAGPFGSGSGLPDGGYIVRVQLSEASVQPQSIQQRIGAQGEYLAGELVSQSRHGLGQIATYSRRFLVGNEPRRTRDQVNVVEEQ